MADSPSLSTLAPSKELPLVGASAGTAWRRFWEKGFVFSGRASRSEYWWPVVILNAIILGIYVLGLATSLAGNSVAWLGLAAVGVSGLVGLVALIPLIAVSVRRLHDANHPGAMYLVTFIPFLGGLILLVLLVQESNPAGARFDLVGAGAGERSLPPLPPQRSGSAMLPVPPPPPESTWGSADAVPEVPGPPEPVPVPDPPASAVGDSEVMRSAPPPEPVVAPSFRADDPIERMPGSSAPVPVAPVPLPPEDDDDLDATRRAAPAGEWVLELLDGRRLPVAGDLYVGRGPVAEPDRAAAVLVPIDDPAKSMSKTHARLTRVGADVEVVDLHSTNGVRVTAESGPAVSLTPGRPHRLAGTSSVSFGDYVVTVRPSGLG